jgi:hypothetical protein
MDEDLNAREREDTLLEGVVKDLRGKCEKAGKPATQSTEKRDIFWEESNCTGSSESELGGNAHCKTGWESEERHDLHYTECELQCQYHLDGKGNESYLPRAKGKKSLWGDFELVEDEVESKKLVATQRRSRDGGAHKKTHTIWEINLLGNVMVQVDINGKTARALIDSGASITVISPRWVEKQGIPYEVRRHPIRVQLADDNAPAWGGGMINLQTQEVELKVLGKSESRKIGLLDLGEQDMILEMDWLRKHVRM